MGGGARRSEYGMRKLADCNVFVLEVGEIGKTLTEDLTGSASSNMNTSARYISVLIHE